ncbi:MAG: hypothetical protein DRP51_05785 [Candidatus Zixiibacteriota bacterium]|nr:MAG: hypothetical protein DRP51_05785 [candidate division Zixibacteria bacterium]HHI02722.1 HTH domain-containing protein [candidate division Zixibacteria bacterium]
MARLERLLYLVNLFKVREKVTLQELVAESGVSKRTVYRDLETLSRMNVPIRYDNGYHLAGDVSLPTFNFTDEEKELIGCSLRCSPLARLPRFRDIINNIEKKILATSDNKDRDSLNNYLQSAQNKTSVFSGKKSAILDHFIKSLMSREPLMIFLKNGEIMNGLLPKSLIIGKNSWELVLNEQDDGTVHNISLKDIEKLDSVPMASNMMAEV